MSGAREVYDFFFTASENIANATLIFISPHNLIQENKICVEAAKIIGSGDKDDKFIYSCNGKLETKYIPSTKTAEVSYIRTDKTKSQAYIKKVSGKVLIPKIEAIEGAEDELLQDLMMEIGTAFKIQLDNLQKDIAYAFRLIVNPVSFNGIPSARNVDSEFKEIKTKWVQESFIYSTYDCLTHYRKLLNRAMENDDFKTTAAYLATIIDDQDLYLARVECHRIIVFLPIICSTVRKSEVGQIWCRGSRNVNDSDLFAIEWEGGIDTYWMDDIRTLCGEIYEYLEKYSGTNPKSKEEISVALQVSFYHEYISLLVDELASLKVIENQPLKSGTYIARFIPDFERENIFWAIAKDKKIVTKINKIGYTIEFSISYEKASEETLKKILARKKKALRTAKIAITAFIIGIFSFLIGSTNLFLNIWDKFFRK